MNSLDWTEAERQVYNAKTSGPTIKQLREDFFYRSNSVDPDQDANSKLGAAFAGILYQISLISGCPLSTNDNEIRAIEEHMIKLMMGNASFRLLTLEDILTAFRLNAAWELGEKVKHFNIFSLDYFGEVLSRYVGLKSKVEHRIETEISKFLPEPAAPTEAENEQLTRDIIQGHYQEFISGALRIDFLQDYEYNLLDKLNLLQLDRWDKDMLMGLGQERRLLYLEEKARNRNDAKLFADAAVDFEKNLATREEHAAIVREAKRLAVWEFFNDLKLLGITDVFSIRAAIKKEKNEGNR